MTYTNNSNPEIQQSAAGTSRVSHVDHNRRRPERLKCKLLASVLSQIKREIGKRRPEHGGLLGGNRDDGIIRHFYFDSSSRRTRTTYSPDHETLNALLTHKWNPQGINLLGFVHSHPGMNRPSYGDEVYAHRILSHNPNLPFMVMPIVQTIPLSGEFKLLPYAALRDGNHVRIEEMDLVVLDDNDADGDQPNPCVGDTFVRVRSAYDLEHLENCRVVYVGAGGAAAFAEDLTRAGVGQHVIIDGDSVSESNLATQQTYRRDIGQPKVECIANRLQDINPAACVIPIKRWLNDEMSDDTFRRLALESMLCHKEGHAPYATLICGLTDNFYAQARVNRLALQFGLPSLCAQVYAEGRGAEVTWTHPDVTPACHRCVLRARYEAYLHKNFRNDVTSDGTPIFATGRLNALKGFIAMALLHHSTNHSRWGGLLKTIGNRNLIQIRMDPRFELPSFKKALAGADHERLLFDDAVWLPQEPDCPANGFKSCPDCGGDGDLKRAKSTFSDTRKMRY